jgi:RimJ/RimL family protein N-acetyltransferase
MHRALIKTPEPGVWFDAGVERRWPRATLLVTARLTLEPLRVAHAVEMVDLLADPAVHGPLGGRAVGLTELRARYTAQVRGASPDGDQGWCNWVLRSRPSREPVGYLQATISRQAGEPGAALAWVVGSAHRRQGYTAEAAEVVAAWLGQQRVPVLQAWIRPDNAASQGVARLLGLRPTGERSDGEECWQARREPAASGITLRPQAGRPGGGGRESNPPDRDPRSHWF